MSGKPPALELPVHKVGEAPWSAKAKELEEKARKQLAAPPSSVSGKGRRTRRYRNRRWSRKLFLKNKAKWLAMEEEEWNIAHGIPRRCRGCNTRRR